MYQLILFLVLFFVYDSGNCSKSENRVSSYMKLIRLYKQKDDKSTEEYASISSFIITSINYKKRSQCKDWNVESLEILLLAAMSPSRYNISIFIWLMRNSVDKICPYKNHKSPHHCTHDSLFPIGILNLALDVTNTLVS